MAVVFAFVFDFLVSPASSFADAFSDETFSIGFFLVFSMLCLSAVMMSTTSVSLGSSIATISSPAIFASTISLDRLSVLVFECHLCQRSAHRVNQVLCEFELFLVGGVFFHQRHIADLADFFRVAEFVDHQALGLGCDQHDVLAVTQHELAHAELAAVFERRREQAVGLAGHVAVGAEIVGGVVEGGVDLGLVHEAFDVDHLGALELQLVEVVLLEDDVHVRARTRSP